MKKILCMILALTVFISMVAIPVFAAYEPDVKIVPRLQNNGTELVYDMEVIYSLGAVNKGRGFSFIVSCDKTVSDDTVLAISEGTADASGVVKIEVTIDAPLTDTSVTPYKIYMNLKNPDYYTDIKTERTVESLTSYQFMINDITSGAGNLEGKIEEYKEELNLDTKYFDKLTDKSKIFEYLKDNKNNIDLLNINSYFDKASLFAYLYGGDVNEIYNMLYYYNKYLALEDIPYDKMIETYDDAGEDLKTAIAVKMQSSFINDTGMVKEKLLENIIFASIETLSKTELDEVLENNLDYVNLNGYKNLTTAVKNKVLTELKTERTFDSIEDLEDFYAAVLQNMNKPQMPSGGGGGGGGSQVSVEKPVATPEGDVKPETPADTSIPFSDIDNHWAKDAITTLYKMGIVNGKSENSFQPDSLITREEFVKLISVAFKLDGGSEALEFTDVPSDAWYYDYLKSAVGAGLIKGINDTDFGTGLNIKREDIAVIIARTKEVSALNYENEKTFNDSSDISDYAKDSVKKLFSLGIINGTPEGNFNPKNTATRAEVCQILLNLLGKI